MRTLVSAISAATALVLAACSSGDRHTVAASLTKPTDLPPASAVAPDDSTIPTGSWGVVTSPQPGGPTDVFAIKAVSIVAGKAGALNDLTTLNGVEGEGVDLATGIPYYIAYTYAALDGMPADAPNQLLYAASARDDTNDIDTLLVPDDEEHCEPPSDDALPTTFGVARHECAVAVAAPGTTPTTLVFKGNTGGSSNVQFAIPPA